MNAKRYIRFWIAVVICSAIIELMGCCQKDEPVCYECWSSTGVHEIFDNTTPETMQHTIEFWAKNGIELKCKQIAP